MPDDAVLDSIKMALLERFGEEFAIDPELSGLHELAKIAGHRSHRHYLPRRIEPNLLRLLCACALSAPSKSDLQQCDIVIVSDAAIRKAVVAAIPDMPWIEQAPTFLVFVANGERLPMMSKLRGKPFPNDHLDQFFNAAVDFGNRAGDIHAGGDGSRAWLLPYQRDPRSSSDRKRLAALAGPSHSGRGALCRLAGTAG